MHIAIAGNIGSGKTTLTGMLAKRFHWTPRFEPVDNNPYLDDFYADMQRWSFNLQIYFLNKRFKEEEDIVNAIPKTLQDNIFDLTQFILTKKMDQARDLVRDLTLQGEDEIKLIAVMLGQFRTFTQVKILSESGQTESQIASSLGSFLGRNPNPYQIKFALRDSRGLSLSFLKQAISYLIETDY